MYFFFDDYKIVQDLYLVSKDETTFIGIKDNVKTAKIDVVLPKILSANTIYGKVGNVLPLCLALLLILIAYMLDRKKDSIS